MLVGYNFHLTELHHDAWTHDLKKCLMQHWECTLYLFITPNKKVMLTCPFKIFLSKLTGQGSNQAYSKSIYPHTKYQCLVGRYSYGKVCLPRQVLAAENVRWMR